MTTLDDHSGEKTDDRGLDRRGVLRVAAGGFVLAASGLLLPEWSDEAEAHEGAYGGRLGGRHGKNGRGLDNAKRRDRGERHGSNKDKDKDQSKAPGGALFRNAALTVNNNTSLDLNLSLDATFYFRVKNGLDDYGLPFQAESRTLSRAGADVAYRYAPTRFRVAALLRPAGSNHAVYADVRNLAFDFPRGFVSFGTDLNPPNGQFGQATITEQRFVVSGGASGTLPWTDLKKVTLVRTPDSDDHVEFSLIVE